MKRGIKITILVVAVIILLYALFVTEESIRLLNDKLSEPLIVFTETYSGPNGDVTYKSLGFKLKNKYACSTTKDECYVTGQDFWLFDTFLLWAWIS